MAKPLKVSRPIVYATLLAVVVGAWFLTSEEQTRRASTRKAPTKAVVTNLPEGFTQEDLGASFESNVDEPRDVFQPLVMQKGSGSEASTTPNGVPSVLTGGDPNWIYTGMAEIDGVSVGLLENKSTGEGDFVRLSEVWKLATVVAIDPANIRLRGASGKLYSLRIPDPYSSPAADAPSGYEPVNPQMRGPIGRVDVQPSNEGNRSRNPNSEGTVAGQNQTDTRDANE